MNNIGFGIFCFGDEYYYKGAEDKIKHILSNGYHCYILTENPEYFKLRFNDEYLHTIQYNRSFKSYHDKMGIVKYVLKEHEIAILIDADSHIFNYSFLPLLKDFNFKNGISYINTLYNHPLRKQFIKDFEMFQDEWVYYKSYTESIYPEFCELETIWEYFLVVNKNMFNYEFFKIFDKLQIAKEFSELKMNKSVSAPAEGMSISVASKVSNTPIQIDNDLNDLLKDKITNVSRKFTSPEFLPDFMK